MLFNSYNFLIFFAIATFFVFLSQHFDLFRKQYVSLLLIASLTFYVLGIRDNHYDYLYFLIASVNVNYLFYKLITWSRSPVNRKRIVFAAIAINLIFLSYFKYETFFYQLLFRMNFDFHALPEIPLGISFWTFTQIAFLIDVNRYREQNERITFVQYFSFVTYFPHLIAGPLLQLHQSMPQIMKLTRKREFFREDLILGFHLFIIGLSKKVFLADSMSSIASIGFSSTSLPFAARLVAALTYYLQIYFDFSGYSDMALGVSKILGVSLPLNFTTPYKSASLIEFWRRWHISLSSFLRDYLYIPLGGNQKGNFRRYLNLLLTMVIGGLWHGANINFIIWGLFHGCGLIINNLIRENFTKRERLFGSNTIIRCVRVLITQIFVCLAWIPFRCVDFSSLRVFATDLTQPSQNSLSAYSESGVSITTVFFYLILGLTIIWIENPNRYHFPEQQKSSVYAKNPRKAFEPQSIATRIGDDRLVADLCLLLLLVFSLARPSVYLYYQF